MRYEISLVIYIDLDGIMNKSIKENWFDLFKELMYTSVALLSTTLNEVKGLLDIDELFINGSLTFSDWLVNETKKAGDFEEASKGSAFFGFFSIFAMFISYSDNIKNAGNGVFSKNTDIVLYSVSLVVDLLSSFIKIPFVDVLISSAGVVIPRVTAMRIGGFIIC